MLLPMLLPSLSLLGTFQGAGEYVYTLTVLLSGVEIGSGTYSFTMLDSLPVCGDTTAKKAKSDITTYCDKGHLSGGVTGN